LQTERPESRNLVKNYDECNVEGSVLHMLIPRDGVSNKQCLMFIERDSEPIEGTASLPNKPVAS
jgi:hypothetical protein